MTDRRFYALDLAVTAVLVAAGTLPLGLAWSALRVGGIDPVYVREAQFIVGLLALLVATVASRPSRPGRGGRDADPDPDPESKSKRGADTGEIPGSRGNDPNLTPHEKTSISSDVVPPARFRVGLYASLTGHEPGPGDVPGLAAHAFIATAALFTLSLGVELLV